MAEVVYYKSSFTNPYHAPSRPPPPEGPSPSGHYPGGPRKGVQRPKTAPAAHKDGEVAGSPSSGAAEDGVDDGYVYRDERYPGDPRQHPYFNQEMYRFPPDPYHGIVDTPPMYRPMPYGPKVLRDYVNMNKIYVNPDNFLKKESRHSVWYRVRKAQVSPPTIACSLLTFQIS